MEFLEIIGRLGQLEYLQRLYQEPSVLETVEVTGAISAKDIRLVMDLHEATARELRSGNFFERLLRG